MVKVLVSYQEEVWTILLIRSSSFLEDYSIFKAMYLANYLTGEILAKYIEVKTLNVILSKTNLPHYYFLSFVVFEELKKSCKKVHCSSAGSIIGQERPLLVIKRKMTKISLARMCV